MQTRMLFVVALFCACLIANPAMTQTGDINLDSYIESLRADVRADKVALITEAMRFDDQESKAFWPVYRQYETDVRRINDQRLALIKSYTDRFVNLTNSDARTLINQTILFESRRIELTKEYAKKFQKAGLSPVDVAKVLQFEHRLNLLVDLQIAAELPALWSKPAGESTGQ